MQTLYNGLFGPSRTSSRETRHASTVLHPSGVCPLGFTSDSLDSPHKAREEEKSSSSSWEATVLSPPSPSSPSTPPSPSTTAGDSTSPPSSGSTSSPAPVPLEYWTYLRVKELLSLEPEELHGHHELLFIVVHQVFELQFKVVLADVDTARRLLLDLFRALDQQQVGDAADSDTAGSEAIDSLIATSALPTTLLTASHFLRRAEALLRWTLSGFDAIGLINPQSFLGFRDHLGSASGFQSLQFRQLELAVGLVDGQRASTAYKAALKEKRSELAEYEVEQGPSLQTALYRWLGALSQRRVIPGLDEFRQRFLDHNLAKSQPPAEGEPLTDEERAYLASARKRHDEHAAFLGDADMGAARTAALFLLTYWDHPRWHVMASIVQYCMDVEGGLRAWRERHLRLVEQMIGAKPGTGKSAGVGYLKATIDYRVLADLYTVRTMQVATYNIDFQP